MSMNMERMKQFVGKLMSVETERTKPFVGRYVCYGEEDGSFSWGRIVDEGFVNTPKGEKEVFILEDRMTCRVPKNDLEMASAHAISRRIASGREPSLLQQKETRLLQEQAAQEQAPQCVSLVPPPETRGLIPALEKEMGLERPKSGLPMAQMVRTIHSSKDPNRTITFVFRRYGYRTNVRKERLNLESDVVSKEGMLSNFTDDELFLFVMNRRMGDMRMGLGSRNMLIAEKSFKGDGVTVEDMESPADILVGMASDELKDRISHREGKVIDV